MPQMADIVIKQADGTTDATYSVVSPSAGDSVPAIWRNNGVGTKVNQRPEYRIVAKTPSQGRRITKSNFVWPVVDPVTGTVVDYITIVVEAKSSDNVLVTDLNQALSQGLNLAAAALPRACFLDGVSAT